jgi:hypothetical protein
MKVLLFALSLTASMNSFAVTKEEATSLVNNLLKNTKVESARHYCVSESMTCRSIYTYRNIKTNNLVPMFRIAFYSSERQVGASEYYVQRGLSSKFNRFVDDTFDGAINISKTDEVQTVYRSGNDFTIKDLHMPKLGTTEYVTSDLVFNDELSYLEGVLRDTANSATQKPIRIEYLRINP